MSECNETSRIKALEDKIDKMLDIHLKTLNRIQNDNDLNIVALSMSIGAIILSIIALAKF